MYIYILFVFRFVYNNQLSCKSYTRGLNEKNVKKKKPSITRDICPSRIALCFFFRSNCRRYRLRKHVYTRLRRTIKIRANTKTIFARDESDVQQQRGALLRNYNGSRPGLVVSPVVRRPFRQLTTGTHTLVIRRRASADCASETPANVSESRPSRSAWGGAALGENCVLKFTGLGISPPPYRNFGG